MGTVIVDEVTTSSRDRVWPQLLDCWIAVSNSGGAAGFPFPPVTAADVNPVLEALLDRLAPQTARLIAAFDDGEVVGWVHLQRSTAPLVAHWGTVRHLQTHPTRRRRGIGRQLMHRCHQLARDDMGLEQLHLAVRGGEGLEPFYEHLGWRIVGRWPAALRLRPGDDRDEVLLALDLTGR